jgi:hypothetical protein
MSDVVGEEVVGMDGKQRGSAPEPDPDDRRGCRAKRDEMGIDRQGDLQWVTHE